ncbi:transposon ty3-I gag-pol polyprotein [Tanacetum coccineum]
MVGTRGTLANTSTSGNAGVNHDNSSGLDAQTKDFIKQLIDSAMQEHVDDLDKVKLASIHFYDSALVWHQQFEKIYGDSISWDEYRQALLARFDTDFEDPLSEIKNLKCDSTVQKYHEKFVLLLNKSKSLADAASFCKLQEVTIAAHKARQSPVLPLPKSNIMSGGFGNRGGKYLSQKEFDDKRAKGLCFHCDQKFMPGHKCSGQAFALELIIDPDPQMEMCLMEGNEEEFVLPDVTNEEIPQISLNALTGLTSYRTIRVIDHFGKQNIHILIDSGSTHNFLDVYMAKNLGCMICEIDPLQFSVVDGNKKTIKSMCKKFSWMLNGEKSNADVMLLPLGDFQHEGRHAALRGTTKSPMQWFSGKQLTKHVIQKAANLSSMSLSLQHDHIIPLKEGANHVNIRPYKHPPSQKDAIESMVQELLDSKVIRPSYSPFSSPIVIVKKKDGTRRMCIDYKKLNKLTIKDKFPIPLIEELINELHGFKVFSKLDLRSGYHQIRMDEKDIPQAAFRTHKGHYEIMVMPFGLTNAPSTFQSLMNHVFKAFLRKFTLVFFDDILVYSASVIDHLQHLKSIMTVMRDNSLHAKKSKYVFGTAQVKYLRHVISNQGVATDPAKISAMVDWPTPTTLKQLRGFIGLTGYYRRFIKNYRVIAQPLIALLKRNAFQWTKQATQSFQALKTAMVQAPVLKLPNFDELFVVETDASGI